MNQEVIIDKIAIVDLAFGEFLVRSVDFLKKKIGTEPLKKLCDHVNAFGIIVSIIGMLFSFFSKRHFFYVFWVILR